MSSSLFAGAELEDMTIPAASELSEGDAAAV